MSKIFKFIIINLIIFLNSCSSVSIGPNNVSHENSLLVILLDKSASMREDNKMEFAKKAAFDAIDELSDSDWISVVGFDNAPFLILPAQEVSSNKELLAKRINSIFPNGATHLLPAFHLSRSIIEKSSLNKKHLLILSDAKVNDPKEWLMDQASIVRKAGGSISTITFGQDGDMKLMRDLARVGDGRFYNINSPSQLPKVFVNDVKSFLAK